MSGPARMLLFVRRAIEVDVQPGYIACVQRAVLRDRLRILADRLIQGRA